MGEVKRKTHAQKDLKTDTLHFSGFPVSLEPSPPLERPVQFSLIQPHQKIPDSRFHAFVDGMNLKGRLSCPFRTGWAHPPTHVFVRVSLDSPSRPVFPFPDGSQRSVLGELGQVKGGHRRWTGTSDLYPNDPECRTVGPKASAQLLLFFEKTKT